MQTAHVDDPNEYRRYLGDVVSLSVLPSLWTEADTRTIASDLTEIESRVRGDGWLAARKTRRIGSPFVYWAPEDRDRIAETFAHGIGGDDVARAGREVSFRRRNGERFDALVLVSPLREQSGSTAGYVASVHDVTERKRHERAAAMLAETGEIAARCLDDRTLLEAVSALAVRQFADWSFVDLVETADRSERMAVAHRDPAGAALAHRLMCREGAPPPRDVTVINAAPHSFSHRCARTPTTSRP